MRSPSLATGFVTPRTHPRCSGGQRLRLPGAGSTVASLAASISPMSTAIAEWYRILAEHGIPPSHRIPHDHHIWRIDLKLANLSDEARLDAVGLDAPRPARATWPACQAVGEQLWRDGWAGLVPPSAARPGSLIACVFDDGVWPPPGCQPSRSIEIIDVPPPPRGMTT